MSAPHRPVHGSPWEPLREPLFRTLWIAAVISYTGTWMQNVGAGWLMTSLTARQARAPLMVGLVQAAASLPVFLVALPAGALADMVDRRRLLLMTQVWMALAAAALGIMTLAGIVTPWILLGFTFLLGLGAVMNDPAWQAITPEVISAPRFASAVALNSAGFNVARSVGPALGGLVIAAAGSGAAFLLNAVSFIGVILFLFRWKRRPHAEPVPLTHVWRAMTAGVEYARHAAPVRAVLVRTALFSFFASALWALLPLIAQRYGSVGYGLLVGALGLGAVAGAALLSNLRRSLSVNTMVAAASLLFALVTFAAGRLSPFWMLLSVLFLGGTAWINILAGLNLSAQTCSAAWVRARSLSMYLLVLQGGMAGGAAIWGELARHIGIANALAWAAAGLSAGVATARAFRLEVGWADVPPPVSTASS